MPLCLEPGLAFTKLNVSDPAKALAFYNSVVGLEQTARIEGGEGEGAFHEFILSRPGSGPAAPKLILMHYYNRPAPAPVDVTVGFMVPDVAEALAAAVAAGGDVVVPVIDEPDHGLKLCFVTDGQGHQVELLQPVRR